MGQLKSISTPAEAAQDYINRRLVPTCGYDWLPFLTALFERNNFTGETGVTTSEGSSAYEIYVPEWTRPGFRNDRELVLPDWEFIERSELDAPKSLRPALLPQDIDQTHSGHDQKWGAYLGQSDSQSRLESANGVSRKARLALQVILDNASSEEKDRMIDSTRARGLRPLFKVDNTAAIAIEVLEEWRVTKEKPLWSDMSMHPDMQQNLRTTDFSKLQNPHIKMKEPYEKLFTNTKEDENWQRFLFKGLTMDELITEDIHTMSDSVTHNLDMNQPLHPLLERNKWEDPFARTSQHDNPRYFYVGNGGKKEWNARRNNEVWEALQPSLQFASRVLNQNPKFWQAIKDLRTRLPIDPNLDRRVLPRTRCLWKMVPVDDVNSEYIPAPVASLHQKHFDFVAQVDRILENGLRFRIVDGHNYPPHNSRNFLDNKHDRTWDPQIREFYGFTEAEERTPGQFEILLSAQMIWPLLVPEYRACEKLCCHFMIAVTILHELMHATHFATAFMCGALGKKYPPNHCSRVSELLEQAGAQLFDMTHADGEPFWKNDAWAELGSAFEYETFGMLTCALPVPGFTSRMITLQPLFLEGYSYPTVFCDDHRYLPVARPIIDFSQPIRIDWLATRFDQGWWDEQVVRYGLDTAGRMTNPANSYYTLMAYDWADEEVLAEMMGEDNYAFMKTVWTLLHRRGMPVLADYCKGLIWSAVPLFGIKSRLRAEYQQRVVHNFWGIEVDPMPKAMEELQTAGWLGLRILECWSNRNHEEGFREWKENIPGQRNACRNQDLSSWRKKMNKHFEEYFTEHGVVPQHVAKIHHIYVREFGKLEQYIHEYFRQGHQESRSYLWPSDEGQSSDEFDWVVLTLAGYRKTASDIRDLVTGIGQHPVLQNTEVPRWTNPWAEVFDAFFQTADPLYEGLMADRRQQLPAADIHHLLSNIKAPSSIWLSRRQQIMNLAHQQYRLASEEIRATVDEFGRRAAIFHEGFSYSFNHGGTKPSAHLRASDLSQENQTPAPYARIVDISNLIAAYTPSAHSGTLPRFTGERPSASNIAKMLSATT
ncbi:hypothetical protein PFICI_12900 [Pestalotiopsis fici W106-1]|uniref:Uncharacterized protein n=1 Tax=Pestalotiopsis fici (strain W106-1 / CGMCC3.15140) TaxID=1229662 RepID=W3WT01_PESFW|nr:uncharacterized protein PFICI_12900 [Pestalotiopsis fici W106-1]ETS75956.1 hypothetical protein PFICI_12900 [Pestalotiopsis fici W106-1]